MEGDFFFYKKWLCHIIWLIFDGEMLRSPMCFACLHIAGVCALTKRLPFLYSSRRVAEINLDKINRSQRQNLKNKKIFQVFSKEKKENGKMRRICIIESIEHSQSHGVDYGKNNG